MNTATSSPPVPHRPQIVRRATAEFVGTGLLVTIVVGSGIAAHRLSPGDVGLQLLENSLTTALGLAVLILMLGPVSGAHFNPAVTIADWWLGRRAGTGIPVRDVVPYVLAQILGGVSGTLLAGVMFDTAPAFSADDRATGGHLIGEVVATAGLVLLIFALARAGKASVTAAAVGAYIGAAYWFTSSTSFANPAVTIARMFTDTFAGIAPASVVPFVLAQLVGAGLGLALLLLFYPTAARAADDVVVPQQLENRH
ncbi:MIP/aquaporin family protein [Microbacterium sp.]|uniref:MIP/aquaporin family protein n=1 Tax=Microbacterium sp. TaxID=51671 RepID=UPI003561B737